MATERKIIYSSIYVNSLRLSDVYASVNQAIIGSDNGLSPVWCQAIIWTNACLFEGDVMNFLFPPEASFGFQELSCLRLSLCVSLCVSICQPWACLHHNSDQARITKFGVLRNALIKIPIVLWGVDLDLQGQI